MTASPVRDITVSGSLWGSRLFRAHGPLMNIHSLAGAIGMGLPMAVGTAIANPQRKVVGLGRRRRPEPQPWRTGDPGAGEGQCDAVDYE